MAEPAAKYIKLPGRGRRGSALFSYARSRLWLGEDHLLNVDFTVASEEYRRFYFRDIEAFVIRRTGGRQGWNWFFGVMLALTAGPFLAAWNSQGEGGFLIAALVSLALWGTLILVNSLRGATCQTHIRTAVQLEQLPSLGRLPMARRVLERVQPLIVAAQGAATPEELGSAPWMAASATPQMSAAPFQSHGVKPVRADRGRIHLWLFGVLLLEALLVGVAFLFFNTPMTVFSMLAMLSGAILSVVAVMRQGDTDLPGGVRAVAKVAIVYYVLKCLAGFVFMMIFAIRHPGTPMLTGLEMIGEPGFTETAAISAALGAVVGLLGFITILGHLRRPAVPPAA